MSKRSVPYISKLYACVLLGLLLISGCVAKVDNSKINFIDGDGTNYTSELTDHDAKAIFAYSQFRMLGIDNRWDDALAALERAISFDPESNYLRLLLARVLLHQQQPEMAIATLNVLFGRDFNHVAGHELLGDIYNQQRNYKNALDQYRLVLELQPEKESAELRLAMTLALLERKDEAIVALESFLLLHPNAQPAKLTLARLYVGKKQLDKATNLYQQILESSPERMQVVLEYGLLLETVDPEAAQQLYLKVIKGYPRAAVVRQRLGQVLLDRSEYDAALIQFQAVLLQFPDNPKVLKQVGLIRLEQQNWAAAESAFRLLVTAENTQDNNRYYLAMALSAQLKTDVAITILEPLVNSNKNSTEASLQLSYLYNKAGRTSAAIEILRNLLTHNIHKPEIYYYLVAFLNEKGEHVDALSIAKSGIEKNPAATKLLYQLGILYQKAGNRDDAVSTMEKVLTYDETHADALNFLAYDQAENGIDLDLALVRAQKAATLIPSCYVFDTLGWVYYKLARYHESRKQLEKATELCSDDAVIWEHLGDVYRSMGNAAAAVDAYQQSLSLDPEATQVADKLEAIPLEKK